MRLIPLAAVLLLLGVVGCEGRRPVPTAEAGEAPPPLATVAATVRNAPLELRLDGYVEAVQQSTVSAQTHARVIELPVDVGDVIVKDQVIARLRDVDAKARSGGAQAALAEAQARLAEAELAYQRARDVWERKLISRAQFDRADTEYKAAQARVAAAQAGAVEAREGLDYTTVRAPFAGIVLKRHVQVGELAAPGTPLISGVSLQHLRVAVDVPEQSIEPVRRWRQARVLLADGGSLDAAALRIAPAADPRSHSFRVLVELPEAAAGLSPGTLVKLAFRAGEGGVLSVPASAIVQRSEVTGLYVLDAKSSRLSFRYVRLGAATADGGVAVLSGLVAGERVVLDPVRAAQLYSLQALPAAGQNGNGA